MSYARGNRLRRVERENQVNQSQMDNPRHKVKMNCHWWLHKGGYRKGCECLTELQCVKNGHCSFYETEEHYQDRKRLIKQRLEERERMIENGDNENNA